MSKTVRVAFDHRIFISQVHGGISRYFTNIATALPRYGVDSRIVAPLHVNAYLDGLPRGTVTGWRVPFSRNHQAQALVRRIDTALLPPLARRFGADIVHETYFSPRRIAPAGMKVALTVYDMIHEIYPEQWANDPTAGYKLRAVRDADLIFCISESTRRDLIAFYPDAADRTVVTLLGFDLPTSLIKDAGEGHVTSGRPFILYVGQRAGYKNFATLLEAYAGSPRLRTDFNLVCVGGGAFTGGERQSINAAGLDRQVRQTDADDRALRRLYQSAALFVYPSLYEGFGLPPLEAMAEGCPVAASDTSSIPEVCGNAAEYFDPKSVGSLAAAIERALFEGDRVNVLKALGSKRLEQFSWECCAKQTAAAYRSIL